MYAKKKKYNWNLHSEKVDFGWLFQKTESEAEICMQVVYWRVLLGIAPVQRQDWAQGDVKLQGSCHRDFKQSNGTSKTGCSRLSQLRDCAFVPSQLASHWIWAAPRERI